MKIVAVLAFRNEEAYLPRVLHHLVDCGIDLALIDHGSTDASASICETFARHVVYQESIAYQGEISLTSQLEAKAKAFDRIEADWLVHQEADEILESPCIGETLRDGIERVDREGFDAICFDQFVFVPTRQDPGHDGRDFLRCMLDYYFYEPAPKRLIRAWKNHATSDKRKKKTQYVLKNQMSLYPTNFPLRHYVALTQEHANRKYSEGRGAGQDQERSWPPTRVSLPDNVALPGQEELHQLPSWECKSFERHAPRHHHFWQPEWAAETIRLAQDRKISLRWHGGRLAS